jgi:hypothetical protein
VSQGRKLAATSSFRSPITELKLTVSTDDAGVIDVKTLFPFPKPRFARRNHGRTSKRLTCNRRCTSRTVSLLVITRSVEFKS